MPEKWPSPVSSSLGIEPSTTSTNGSSSPRSAWYQASMNSAPTSYASTGLCTTTRGMPGITPWTMSSRLGLVAEVMATESPSQDNPVVIHMTCAVTASVAC